MVSEFPTFALPVAAVLQPAMFGSIFQKEDKFYIARCPELGVTSQGESLEEAQANIKEAVELYIESFGEELPR